MIQYESIERRARMRAYGQDHGLTAIDHFGVWLSSRRIRRSVRGLRGKCVADVGCGYRATLTTPFLDEVDRLVLLDVAIEPGLLSHPKVTGIQGLLPATLAGLADGSQDVVICNSVLEHLWRPLDALRELERILAVRGMLLLNVPSWRGKRCLELAAFRLGLAPAEEIDDHKMYYDPRDLWPLLVRAGFRPGDIRCFRHKLGLNTFALCRKARLSGA
ncbi:MAG TPA: methyltransferase domain-containing protein [Candidatus Dormibacteraeota bacterium]